MVIDDLHDPAGSRLDKYRSLVDNRVSIAADAVLGWNPIIGHTGLWQDSADPNLFLIAIGLRALGDDILTELRLLLVGNAPDNCTAHCANRGAPKE